MSGHRKFREIAADVFADPVRRAHIEEIGRAMDDSIRLAQLREQRVGSQQAMAERLATSQVRVSQIERSDDLYLSTLERYVTALGGQLKIVAEFPDGAVTLTHRVPDDAERA